MANDRYTAVEWLMKNIHWVGRSAIKMSGDQLHAQKTLGKLCRFSKKTWMIGISAEIFLEPTRKLMFLSLHLHSILRLESTLQ